MRPNPQVPSDLVTFTEEILNEKLHLICSARLIVLWLFLKLNSTAKDSWHDYKMKISNWNSVFCNNDLIYNLNHLIFTAESLAEFV